MLSAISNSISQIFLEKNCRVISQHYTMPASERKVTNQKDIINGYTNGTHPCYLLYFCKYPRVSLPERLMTSSGQGPVDVARGRSMEHDSFLSLMLQQIQLTLSFSMRSIHNCCDSGSILPSPDASVTPLSETKTGIPFFTASSMRSRRYSLWVDA